MQKLPPDIRQLSEFYVFQQDTAPNLLTMETPDFIPPTLWLPNSPDLNLVHCAVMLKKVYKGGSRTSINCICVS